MTQTHFFLLIVNNNYNTKTISTRTQIEDIKPKRKTTATNRDLALDESLVDEFELKLSLTIWKFSYDTRKLQIKLWTKLTVSFNLSRRSNLSVSLCVGRCKTIERTTIKCNLVKLVRQLSAKVKINCKKKELLTKTQQNKCFRLTLVLDREEKW